MEIKMEFNNPKTNKVALESRPCNSLVLVYVPSGETQLVRPGQSTLAGGQ